MKQFRLVAVYLQKRLPVSEKRGSLHYLYSLTLAPFWSCCILNALLKVNIKNHINVCKTLLLEPMANITRKVLPAVLLEIVRFSWYDSLDCSSPSTTSAVLWGRLVYGSTYLSNSLRISDLVLELWNSPYTDNAGGYVWFSWEKNWCRSLLRLWQATYKLENKWQSCFNDVSLYLIFDTTTLLVLLYKGNLFRLMVS